jgi:hypothetical protein
MSLCGCVWLTFQTKVVVVLRLAKSVGELVIQQYAPHNDVSGNDGSHI